MKTITGYVATNMIGSRQEFSFKVDDDCTDEEIKEMAKEAMLDLIEWDYKINEKGQ